MSELKESIKMGEHEEDDEGGSLASVANRLLEGVIVVALSFWVVFWIITPLSKGAAFLLKVDHATKQLTFLGVSGSVFIFQSIPIILATLLSLIVMDLRNQISRSTSRLRKSDEPQKTKRISWTTPVFIRSPLGILSVADLTFISVILFLTIWPFTKTTVEQFRVLENSPIPMRWTVELKKAAVNLGKAGIVPFSLLWIPVSRGSPILRFLGVPYERAIRYHTWLAQLALTLFLGHGVGFLISVKSTHTVAKVFHWTTHAKGAAFLPGFMMLIGFSILWLTALPVVRRKFFELFYVAHHLYIPMLILLACHVVKEAYIYIVPVLLFFVDRLIRFLESRKLVDVLSSKVLPSGAIELTFAQPTGTTYHPLSTVYIFLPSVSKLQWHPFSVTSSALDGKSSLSIIVKPGTGAGWTGRLHQQLKDTLQSKSAGTLGCPFSFKASVEGPYSDETNFFLRHKSLVLVAGGIGITPFLAILRDILHRYRLQEHNAKPLPESIEIFLCVRNKSELAILNTVDPCEIFPDWESHLRIQVHAFVTTNTLEKPLEALPGSGGTKDDTSLTPFESYQGAGWNTTANEIRRLPINRTATTAQPTENGTAHRETTSPLKSRGNNGLPFATILASFIAFIVLWGFASTKLIPKCDITGYKNYMETIYLLGSLALAVGVCGGTVVFLWFFTRKGNESAPTASPVVEAEEDATVEQLDAETGISSLLEGDEERGSSSPWKGTLHMGSRPNWRDEFIALCKRFQGQNVEVLVSGPMTLLADVAEFCQRRTCADVAFHFHSVSFEL